MVIRGYFHTPVTPRDIDCRLRNVASGGICGPIRDSVAKTSRLHRIRGPVWLRALDREFVPHCAGGGSLVPAIKPAGAVHRALPSSSGPSLGCGFGNGTSEADSKHP